MLALLGENGYEPVADAYEAILKDDQLPDAVKYWVLHGYRDLFNQGPLKNKEREARGVVAIISFLGRKPTYSANASQEEFEGFRYVRREALRALAMSHYPAVADAKGNLTGRTAQVLLQVLNKDIDPEPRLDEQIEAATGLARMKADLTKGYHPDYSAFYVGQFLLEFAERYVNRKEGTRDAAEPWKVYAVRLEDGLDAMKEDARSQKEAAAYVAGLAAKSMPVLKSIEAGSKASERVTGDLGDWLKANPPKSAMIYEGVKDSVVKPAEKTEAAAPGK